MYVTTIDLMLQVNLSSQIEFKVFSSWLPFFWRGSWNSGILLVFFFLVSKLVVGFFNFILVNELSFTENGLVLDQLKVRWFSSISSFGFFFYSKNLLFLLLKVLVFHFLPWNGSRWESQCLFAMFMGDAWSSFQQRIDLVTDWVVHTCLKSCLQWQN